MKFSTKVKYVTYGIIGAAVLIPLTLKAVETIPLTFKEGDVISASVINTLLSRVNDVQKGFTAASELNGSWSCTTYSPVQNSDPRCIANGMVYTKTGVMTFNSTAGTWSYAGSGGGDGPQSCGSFSSSGTYEVRANRLLLASPTYAGNQPGVFPLTRANPTVFRWDGINASIIECSKTAAPPAPADALTATVSVTSVALTWTDQSTDETGFKVQRKTSVSGMWADVTTTAANAISYNDTGLTGGKYWYRVIATNSNGDAMSSSEVQAIIP